MKRILAIFAIALAATLNMNAEAAADADLSILDNLRQLALSQDAQDDAEKEYTFSSFTGRFYFNTKFASRDERRTVDQTFSDGSRYVGQVNSRGEMDGKGIFYFADCGDVYEGDFKRNCFEGEGVLTTEMGHIFEGRFESDIFVEGTHILPGEKGLKDVGHFVNKRGVILLAEGIRYYEGYRFEGRFTDNKPSGEGKTYFDNGDVYSGTHVEGWRQGTGTMTKADGTVAQGEWKAGKWMEANA